MSDTPTPTAKPPAPEPANVPVMEAKKLPGYNPLKLPLDQCPAATLNVRQYVFLQIYCAFTSATAEDYDLEKIRKKTEWILSHLKDLA